MIYESQWSTFELKNIWAYNCTRGDTSTLDIADASFFGAGTVVILMFKD